MREFNIGVKQSENVEMECGLIGGLKTSSCEFMAKINQAEKRDLTIGNTRIHVEEKYKSNLDVPMWIIDY